MFIPREGLCFQRLGSIVLLAYEGERLRVRRFSMPGAWPARRAD